MSGDEVALVGIRCTNLHGNPGNSAPFYGHWGRVDVCVRVGDDWYHSISRPATAVAERITVAIEETAEERARYDTGPEAYRTAIAVAARIEGGDL